MAEHQGRPDHGPDVGILVTIRALLPNLAPVERRVAQVVLDDPAGVAWRSISELARSCGTSATSVVRFCRAVGPPARWRPSRWAPRCSRPRARRLRRVLHAPFTVTRHP